MSHIYTPSTNIIANIKNRRSKQTVVENLKVLNTFDSFIRSETEYGDTLEHIMTALSETSDYDVKGGDYGNYKDTVLNKWYTKRNHQKKFDCTTSEDEYQKALTSPQEMAKLIASIEGKQFKSWKRYQYEQFVSLIEGDTGLKNIEIENFDDFNLITKEERADKIEKMIQLIFQTIYDMSFYSNDYITVDSNLTQAQQDRMIATADKSELVVLINAKYYTWMNVDLSARFRDNIDVDTKVTFKIVKFTDDSIPVRIVHNMRYQYVPNKTVSQELTPFGTLRTDHTLITLGTFAKVPLFPGAKFTKKVIPPTE